MNKKIRVFHLEDYTIIRDGVKFIVNADPLLEYAGSESDPQKFYNILNTISIDVLILDLYLDDPEQEENINGFEVCDFVTKHFRSIKVIAHTAYKDPDRVTRMLQSGARGFVSKMADFQELTKAIHVVMKGEIYISRNIANNLKNLPRFLLGIDGRLKGQDEIFSTRELEVANLLASGNSSKEIGEKLSIAERTVETHRKNMLEKATVRNTVELVAHMSSLGLLKR